MATRQTRVENGMLEGVPAGNRSYTVFRSVPYAAAPVSYPTNTDLFPGTKGTVLSAPECLLHCKNGELPTP